MAYPMERTHLPNAAKAIAVVERNERQASSMEEPQLEITFWWRRILVYWIGLVILLTTFPWVVGPPYWEGVVWTPFLGVRHSFRLLFDACANIGLYVPLGLAFVQLRSFRAGWAMIEVGILAALLSICCELYQIFSPWRYPTMTDVVANTMGALLGAAIGSALRGKKLVLVFTR